ncbi:hypothetical protein FSP39_005236 [Pinctada imbricata]|uniref:Thioredoxin domain-containing protein 17 n=1 Tax=Pinctada imbricata TaxID=66713 RepID=A0AA88XG67_PINIB|nr:hypothetical protein FSP39_005236 [Pinctada imbricata]
MAKHVKCEGIDEFKAEAQKHKGKTVFVLFSGSTDKDGKSWCPDCETAHPVIERNLQHIPEDAVYIYCSVGDRD